MNQKYYHLTRREYLDSIYAVGILPYTKCKKKGLTLHHTQTAVFITNDVNYVAYKQAGEDWCKKYDLVVLEIDTEGLEFEPVQYRFDATYTLSNFEFITNEISVEKIVCVRELSEFLKEAND